MELSPSRGIHGSRRGVEVTALCFAILLLLIGASTATAQTRPAAPTTVESQIVQRNRSAATTPGENGIHWQRLVIALAVVLGLIVGLRYLAGWLMPHTRANGPGRGVRVVARTPVAPRQQVLLLHVGRRILVVGDSAGTLSPLANIDDPDEVAELLGQAASVPVTNKFGSFFGKAEDDYDPNHERMTPADDPDHAGESRDPAVDAAKSEISGLLERMRSITKNVQK